MYGIYGQHSHQNNRDLRPFGPVLQEISQIHLPIGDHVFGPFPKVAHPLHEKSAKDGALCKSDKKEPETLA